MYSNSCNCTGNLFGNMPYIFDTCRKEARTLPLYICDNNGKMYLGNLLLISFNRKGVHVMMY